MKTKICSPQLKYYRKHRQRCLKQMKKWRQEHPDYYRERYQTLNGYLRDVFGSMKYRCNNPKCKIYKYYGGRGIKCLFTSDEFIDYVVNILGYNTYEKIKGLTIDRINNNGNYEKGNIRFITQAENNKNHLGDKNDQKTKTEISFDKTKNADANFSHSNHDFAD